MRTKDIKVGKEYATRPRSYAKGERIRVLELKVKRTIGYHFNFSYAHDGVRVQYLDDKGLPDTMPKGYGSSERVPRIKVMQSREVYKPWSEYVVERDKDQAAKDRQVELREQAVRDGEGKVSELEQYGISAQVGYRGSVSITSTDEVLAALRNLAHDDRPAPEDVEYVLEAAQKFIAGDGYAEGMQALASVRRYLVGD